MSKDPDKHNGNDPQIPKPPMRPIDLPPRPPQPPDRNGDNR